MGSNASEENIWALTRVQTQTREETNNRGIPVEYAARRAAHDVEHVERNLTRTQPNADVAYLFRQPR